MKEMNRYARTVLAFLLLQAVALLAYRQLLSAPISNPVDVEVLYDTHRLSTHFAAMRHHIGAYFSQPLLQLVFLLEYRLFHLDPAGYYAVNIFLHACNGMMVYLLVNMLFAGEGMALPAALLFVLGVGHYSKPLMSINGTEPLLLTFFYLVVLFGLIRDDFHHGGRLTSRWFLLALAVYLLAGLTRPASLSILLCLLAYKLFFYHQRGRREVLSNNLWVLVAIGAGFAIAQRLWGFREPPIHFDHPEGALGLTWLSIKNIFRYLNLMVFPLQTSDLLQSANAVVKFLYDWRVVIRSLVSLTIVSFSFFGFVFGSRPLRFFLAWTYLTILPFALISPPTEWLNIQYLYTASVGFCVVLAAGVTGCMRLLDRHPRKRWVPVLLPALLVAVSLHVNHRLHHRNVQGAHSPRMRALLEELREKTAPPPPVPGARS